MRAGLLRHQVTVQVPAAPTVEDGGGFSTTWTALHDRDTVAASIEPATAANIERRVGAQVQAKVTHLVTLRYLAGVTTECRVLFGSRIFQVRGIQNRDERNVMLTLACEELLS